MKIMWKPLSKPEQEIDEDGPYHKMWYVFVDDDEHNYEYGDLNFLHRNGMAMAKLDNDEVLNGHIMFETEIEAYAKSVYFYAKYNKQEEYPWYDEAEKALGINSGEVESQVMRFE